MFSNPLKHDEGILLDLKKSSKSLSAIHMLFVFFPIRVYWLDEQLHIVDTVLAKPFHLHYGPKSAARYILETHRDNIFSLGTSFSLKP